MPSALFSYWRRQGNGFNSYKKFPYRTCMPSYSFLKLNDSENFTIMIVEVVTFMIMNTIMIVDLLNISIH